MQLNHKARICNRYSRQWRAIAASIACGTLLTGCGVLGEGGGNAPASYKAPATAMVSDTPVKIGEPYIIDGERYVPQQYDQYDEVGLASWYGQENAGRLTANSESFRPSWVSAAHKTLPLPSYVEVTELNGGRTILVRINDRGPFVKGRVIDLSAGAAEQLGIAPQGVTPVRVRLVSPHAFEKRALRSGEKVQERQTVSSSFLSALRNAFKDRYGSFTASETGSQANSPSFASANNGNGNVGPSTGTSFETNENRVLTPQNGEGAGPPPSHKSPAQRRDGEFIIVDDVGGDRVQGQGAFASSSSSQNSGIYVQVARFANRERAERLANQIGGFVINKNERGNWGVQSGPFNNRTGASDALKKIKGLGFPDAYIVEK